MTLRDRPQARPIFIEAGPRVYEGEAALERLATVNDAQYVIDGLGVPAVDEARWRLAQEAEHSHWFEPGGSGRVVADDRNLSHRLRFAGYEVLRGRTFDLALEIGCGPFTNLRLIATECRVRSCALLDPAMDSYLTHRSAYYDRQVLYLAPPSRWFARFWARIARPMRVALRAAGRTIPVARFVAAGAEAAPSIPADLVVMVNVLEHCRDAREVLGAAVASVRPGGILVLSDKVYSPQVVADRAMLAYDQAHPLKVTAALIEPAIKDFTVLYEASVRDTAVEPYMPDTFERYWILQRD